MTGGQSLSGRAVVNAEVVGGARGPGRTGGAEAPLNAPRAARPPALRMRAPIGDPVGGETQGR